MLNQGVVFERRGPPSAAPVADAVRESPFRKQLDRLEKAACMLAEVPDIMASKLSPLLETPTTSPDQRITETRPVVDGSDLAVHLASIADRLEIAHDRIRLLMRHVDI